MKYLAKVLFRFRALYILIHDARMLAMYVHSALCLAQYNHMSYAYLK